MIIKDKKEAKKIMDFLRESSVFDVDRDEVCIKRKAWEAMERAVD